jgi:hypothetical protein
MPLCELSNNELASGLLANVVDVVAIVAWSSSEQFESKQQKIKIEKNFSMINDVLVKLNLVEIYVPNFESKFLLQR